MRCVIILLRAQSTDPHNERSLNFETADPPIGETVFAFWRFDGDDAPGWHAIDIVSIDAERILRFSSAATGASASVDLKGDRLVPGTADGDADEQAEEAEDDAEDDDGGDGATAAGGGGAKKKQAKKKSKKPTRNYPGKPKDPASFEWTKFLSEPGLHSRWHAGATPFGLPVAQGGPEVRVPNGKLVT